MISLRRSSLVVLALALFGCRRGASSSGPAPSASVSASSPVASVTASGVVPASSSSAVPAPRSAVPLEPATPVPPPSTFVGARTDKECKAQTVEVATYQQRGDMALGASKDGVAAAWRLRLVGKPQEQVAFAPFDKDGKATARARGIGLTTREATPRPFASGSDWTVVWFDDKGLAYTRPHAEQQPPAEIAHLGALGPEVAADVALAASPTGAVLAAAPFGAGKAQLGLFLFAPVEDAAAVRAFGVTHHAKEPHRPALTEGAFGTLVMWDEGGALLASRFDAAGKEAESPCTIAPAGPEKRDRLAVVTTGASAVAMWMEGTRVRTRALDGTGCPSSPIWTIGEGRWASLTALGDAALVAWVASDGRLLAARLRANGAPPERGLDAGEGTSGVKDPPSVTALGTAKIAFGWAESMSPVVSTKRLNLRIVDAACVP